MKNIIWFRTDNLGDLLIQSSFMLRLYQDNRDCCHIIVCSPVNYPLAKEYKFFSEIFVYDKKGSFFKKAMLIYKIVSKKYEISISLDGKIFSQICLILMKSKKKLQIVYKKKIFFKFFSYYRLKPLFFKRIYDMLNINIQTLHGRENKQKYEHLPTIYGKFLTDHTKSNFSSYDKYFFPINDICDINVKKLIKNLSIKDYVIFHIDEKCVDMFNAKVNSHIFFEKLYQKFVCPIFITYTNKNLKIINELKENFKKVNFQDVNSLNFNGLSEKVIIIENTNIFEFERLINYSKISISCHSGFLVQVAGSNSSNVLDILNDFDCDWIDCWIPKSIEYKRVLKSINNNLLTFENIIKQIQ